MASPRATAQARCKNLYRFIRLRLGEGLSDRELARRWDMEWRSFAALKHGARQVPRIEELERLAKALGMDAGFVFQVARGVDADEVVALLERETRLKALVDRFRDGVLTMDPQGRLQDANPALGTLAGVDMPALLRRSLIDLLAPESVPVALGALAAIARDGQVSDIELVLRRPSGEPRTVRFDATRITDAGGSMLGAQAILRDVTVERLLARELERQRVTLQTIFDSVPAACILFEADGTIAAANPLVEQVTHASAEEMIGKNAIDVFGSHGPEDCPVTRAIQTGKIEQQVSWVENKRHERVYVHRTAGPITADGKVGRVIEIMVDVTEQIHRGDLRVLQFWREQPPAAPSGDPRERRAFPRASTSFPAELRHHDKARSVSVENLAQEGVYLRSQEILSIGAEVELEWELPTDRSRVCARGVVVWRRPSRSGQPGGMGVRFLHLAPKPDVHAKAS
jgi:PAS domain S-box-containing protein